MNVRLWDGITTQFSAFWDSTAGFLEVPTLDQGQVYICGVNFDIIFGVNDVNDMGVNLHLFFLKISKTIFILW